MKCPYCESIESKVVDKRGSENDFVTRRRRECLNCEKRYTTYERIESVDIIIVKKDGKREKFDKLKLERGIVKACEKRPVPTEEIKKMVNDIEAILRSKESTEIPSSHIGRLVMTRLKKLDKVSYIRFASVYKDFKEIEELHEEVEKLVKKNE